MNKNLVILLTLILTASSLIAVEASQASVTKPSVPEFALKFVDYSYEVPPTYGIDQFTGKNVITQEGHHVDNRSIQFTIKNQPFTPYNDSSGLHIGLYYNFRVKGAYGNEWRYYPFAPNGVTTRRYGGIFWGNSSESPEQLSASNSEYTSIPIALTELFSNFPAEGQVECQVQAIIGHMEPTDYMMAGHVYVFTGESSDWSNSQTITIGGSAPDAVTTPDASTPNTSPSQNSTTTPNQSTDQSQNSTSLSTDQSGSQNAASFILDWEQLAILILVGLVILLAVWVLRLRKRNTKRT